MFFIREPDEILTWFVAFRTARPPEWWMRLLIRGRFTHVTAFAKSEATRTWVFLDPNMHMTRVFLAPDGPSSDALVGQVCAGAFVLKISARSGMKFRLRPMFCCTVAIRHLLNLPGSALSVDALWRDCLANGAETVIDEHPAAAA